MEKPTDITERSQAPTSDAAEKTQTDSLEKSDSPTSGAANPILDNPEESEALVDGATAAIQPGTSAGSTPIPSAMKAIETENPADSFLTSGIGEGQEVNSSGKPTSTDSKDIVEIQRSEMRPQLWSRRRVMTLGVSLAAGFVATFWSPLIRKLGSLWQLSATRRRDNPYFRLKKSLTVYASVGLDEGFYARKSKPMKTRPAANYQRRNIIQYVDSEKRILFVKNISESTLRSALPAELAVNGFTLSAAPTPKFPSTHVSLGHASALFERAALEKLKTLQYGPACELLIDGIRHDLAFKQRRHEAPSLRLLDLLAIVSVRRNQKEPFEELLKLGNEIGELMKLQKMAPAARRQRRKNKPPTKKGRREDNPRKRRFPLDAAGEEIARANQLATLHNRVEKWNGETWKAKIKQKKIVKWEMRILPVEIKGKSEKEMSKKEKRELEKKKTVRLEI